MRHWPKRKLSKADGEYILWHVLEHLQVEQGSSSYYLDGFSDAVDRVRSLLSCELPTDTDNASTHNIDIAYARACNGRCADCGATPEECFKRFCVYSEVSQ